MMILLKTIMKQSSETVNNAETNTGYRKETIMSSITMSFRETALRNGILVRNKNTRKPAGEQLELATMIELSNLGFMINDTKALKGCSLTELEKMLETARKIIGVDRNMTPVYAGYPQQVEELDTMTLLFEQILHYWTFGEYLPNHPTIAREGLPLKEMLTGVKVITVMTGKETVETLLHKTVTSGIAMSDTNIELVEAILKYDDPSKEIIEKILADAKNGENIHRFCAAYLSIEKNTRNRVETTKLFVNAARNPDQVLRYVIAAVGKPSRKLEADHTRGYEYSSYYYWNTYRVRELLEEAYNRATYALSDKHAKILKFGNLSRAEKRIIMNRLGELAGNRLMMDIIVSRINLWRRVFKMIHPHDQNISGKALKVVDIVHGNIEYQTVRSEVEENISKNDYRKVVQILSEHSVGELFRKVVFISRKANRSDYDYLLETLETVGMKAPMSTIISTINAVHASRNPVDRIVSISGLRNQILKPSEPLSGTRVKTLVATLEKVLKAKLSTADAPTSDTVGIGSIEPVALMRRDLSKTERVMDRGSRVAVSGDETKVLRTFGHWRNNMHTAGYMDIGVVVLDENYDRLAVSTWNSWDLHRDWSTYSGDKYVKPHDSAAEYIDVKLDKLVKRYKKARFIAFTIQSWSGFRISDVDMIAGAMFRDEAEKGEVFEPRTVVSAFKPTTISTQAVPYVYDMKTKELIWIDGSSGSKLAAISSVQDKTIEIVVKDALANKKLSYGDLARLWAEAHDVETTDEPVDKEIIDNLLKK